MSIKYNHIHPRTSPYLRLKNKRNNLQHSTNKELY